MTREHQQERRGRRHMIQSQDRNEELDEKIRQRACELYESRDGAQGDPESDWYQAEAEIAPPKPAREH